MTFLPHLQSAYSVIFLMVQHNRHHF